MSGRPFRPNLGRLAGVVRGEQERNLGGRAVRLGLLKEEELAALLAAGTKIEDALLARGVDPADIARLRQSIDREEYAFFRPDRRLPPEVELAGADPERRLAEFIRVEPLGTGGLGEVWKAWDTRLGRWVAIKLPALAPTGEAASQRFSREALAAARLSHPNIVSIHRVAEEKGRPFIVMQYVEGRTLGRMKPALREALEIMRTVSLAVHHAHEQGVIHRDVKPGNIMIGNDGRAFVLDFGLAHLQDGAQSREGLVAGTAAYMSPEQARGDASARERATDVYSLGATLYELATGRAPFAGATFAETVHRVIHQDPALPRALNPILPREAELVILKAMDKEPRRRYLTAQALAEDLDRCLRGEPLAAQGETGLRTLRRWSRRHPRIWAGAAVGASVLVALLLLWRVDAGREQKLVRVQETKVQAIRDLSRIALEAAIGLRRAGAGERMSEFLPRMESSYVEGVATDPSQPELDYLMGRFQRALLNEDRALELQERALAKAPDYPPALYERILLQAKRFGRRLTETRLRSPAGEGVMTAEASRRLRWPGLAEMLAADPDLTRMHDELARGCEKLGEKPAPGLTEGHVLAAQGVFALHRGGFTAARELLSRAISANPSLEEAWESLGEAWLSGGGEGMATEEEALDHAERIYTHAIVHDRGYGPHWTGRGRARAARAQLKAESGRDPEADLQAAEDDFGEALRLGLAAAGGVGRAMVRAVRGTQRMRLGENPLRDWQGAEEDADRVLGPFPGHLSAMAVKGYVRRVRAEHRFARNEDPTPELQAFDRESGTATSPEISLTRGMLRARAAAHRARKGEDASAEFVLALRSLEEALKSDPLSAGLWERRAQVRLLWGRDLEAAADDAARALELAPHLHQARLTRAVIRRVRAGKEEQAGRESVGLLSDAMDDVTEILKQNPRSTEAWAEGGRVALDWGRHLQKFGDAGAGREHFTNAARHFEEALRLNEALSGALREPLREARRGLLGSTP